MGGEYVFGCVRGDEVAEGSGWRIEGVASWCFLFSLLEEVVGVMLYVFGCLTFYG